jgi:uncharacterized protein YdhG (YjbR/CyaY superfamily)
MANFKDIDEYIASFPTEVQIIIKNIRELVKEVAPEAEEMISYNMPTFVLNKKRFYFAANKKHIGVYAIYQPTSFEDELTDLRSSKDTVQFPLDEPINYELIKKLVKLKLFE